MSLSDNISHHRARVGALSRTVKTGERQPDDPELINAQRDLAAANLDQYIRRVVDAAPALTIEQRTQLAELLKPVRVKPPATPRTRRARRRGAA